MAATAGKLVKRFYLTVVIASELISNFHCVASFYRRYQLVDTWMMWARSAEEIALVKREMGQYLKLLMKTRAELKDDLKLYHVDLPFPSPENPLIAVINNLFS